MDKTESIAKTNKDIEEKIRVIEEQLDDDEQAKRHIQENFSQKYFVIQRKLE